MTGARRAGPGSARWACGEHAWARGDPPPDRGPRSGVLQPLEDPLELLAAGAIDDDLAPLPTVADRNRRPQRVDQALLQLVQPHRPRLGRGGLAGGAP